MLIENLQVEKDKQLILNDLNIELERGNTHIIMGPNGSGKSTLAYSIAGHPDCIVKKGNIFYENKNILELSIEERAIQGIHLSPQYPPVMEGLSHAALLKESINVRRNFLQMDPIDNLQFLKLLREKAKKYNFEPKSYPRQSLNDGFSGGERKRNEILQIELLNPDFVILDEIDSGLDIESMRVISKFLVNYGRENPQKTLVVITHYPEFAKLLNPNRIHILKAGKISATEKDKNVLSIINKIIDNGFGEFT